MKRFIKFITIYILVIISCLCMGSKGMTEHTVRATKYYAGHRCGIVTADGSKISVSRVHNFTDKWVALSPDMFRKGYKFGDVIHVTSDNQILNGHWVVKDKMASYKKNSIDFLMTRGNSKEFNNPCHVTIRKVK